MSRSSGVRFLLILIVLTCAPISFACEKCSQWFDYQALEECFYCEYSYCGYFGCAVYQNEYFDYCDSQWPDSGDDEQACASSEGIGSGRCGNGDPYASLVAPVTTAGRDWKLIRFRIIKAGSAVRSHQRRG
jgi:hypothetical protein